MIINQSDTSIFLRQSQKLKVLLTIPPKERTDGHIKEISVLVQVCKITTFNFHLGCQIFISIS